MDILIKNMEMPTDEMHSVVLVFGKDGFEEARDSYSTLKIEGITAVALPEHGDLVEISKVKEAQCIHGQASPWERYVPIIVEATNDK